MWLGDNPLHLNSAEFRNQYKRILPLESHIKCMIRISSCSNCIWLFSHDLSVFLLNVNDLPCLALYMLYNLLTNIFTLAYPFIFALCLSVSLLQWSPCWWEHMGSMWKVDLTVTVVRSRGPRPLWLLGAVFKWQ